MDDDEYSFKVIREKPGYIYRIFLPNIFHFDEAEVYISSINMDFLDFSSQQNNTVMTSQCMQHTESNGK